MIRKFQISFLLSLSIIIFPLFIWAKSEKPIENAEVFFRLILAQDYTGASNFLSTADHAAVLKLQKQIGKKGKSINLEKIISESFSLTQSQNNSGLSQKKDAETIMPQRISFFVPGQYYIVGNFAAVFTRETYEIAHNDTGPVRDDPRKLWINPINILAKVRDEAYFKQWWVWEGDRLTIPGIIWMVKEKNSWKIDLFSGTVPQHVFDKDLYLYFGRDIFDTDKNSEKKISRLKKKVKVTSVPPKK